MCLDEGLGELFARGGRIVDGEVRSGQGNGLAVYCRRCAAVSGNDRTREPVDEVFQVARIAVVVFWREDPKCVRSGYFITYTSDCFMSVSFKIQVH